MNKRIIRAAEKRAKDRSHLMIDAEGIVYFDDGQKNPSFEAIKPVKDPTIVTLDFIQDTRKSVGIAWLEKRERHIFMRARFWVEPRMVAELTPALGFALKERPHRIWHRLFRLKPKIDVKSIGIALTSSNVDKRIRPMQIKSYTSVKGNGSAPLPA